MPKVNFDLGGGRIGVGGSALKVAKNTLQTFTKESEVEFTNFMSEVTQFTLERVRFHILDKGVYLTGATYFSAYKVEPPNRKVRKQYRNSPVSEQRKASSPRSTKNYKDRVKIAKTFKPKLARENQNTSKVDATYRPLDGKRPQLGKLPFLPPIPTDATTAYSAVGVSTHYAYLAHAGLGTHTAKGPRPFVSDAFDDTEKIYGSLLANKLETLARRKSAKS